MPGGEATAGPSTVTQVVGVKDAFQEERLPKLKEVLDTVGCARSHAWMLSKHVLTSVAEGELLETPAPKLNYGYFREVIKAVLSYEKKGCKDNARGFRALIERYFQEYTGATGYKPVKLKCPDQWAVQLGREMQTALENHIRELFGRRIKETVFAILGRNRRGIPLPGTGPRRLSIAPKNIVGMVGRREPVPHGIVTPERHQLLDELQELIQSAYPKGYTFKEGTILCDCKLNPLAHVFAMVRVAAFCDGVMALQQEREEKWQEEERNRLKRLQQQKKALRSQELRKRARLQALGETVRGPASVTDAIKADLAPLMQPAPRPEKVLLTRFKAIPLSHDWVPGMIMFDTQLAATNLLGKPKPKSADDNMIIWGQLVKIDSPVFGDRKINSKLTLKFTGTIFTDGVRVHILKQVPRDAGAAKKRPAEEACDESSPDGGAQGAGVDPDEVRVDAPEAADRLSQGDVEDSGEVALDAGESATDSGIAGTSQAATNDTTARRVRARTNDAGGPSAGGGSSGTAASRTSNTGGRRARGGGRGRKVQRNDLHWIEEEDDGEFPYITKEILDTIKNKNVLFLDPGRRDIWYGYHWCSTKNKPLRFRLTANLVNIITGRRARRRILRMRKPKHIKDKEAQLAAATSRDVNNSTAFLAYLRAWKAVAEPLGDYYGQPYFRQLRMDGYRFRKSLEAWLVRTLKNKFGDDVTVVIGDWSPAKGIKHHEPMAHLGFKRALKQAGIPVYLEDEYNTSKVCPYCGGVLKTFLYVPNPRKHRRHSKEKVKCHGLLYCDSQSCKDEVAALKEAKKQERAKEGGTVDAGDEAAVEVVGNNGKTVENRSSKDDKKAKKKAKKAAKRRSARRTAARRRFTAPKKAAPGSTTGSAHTNGKTEWKREKKAKQKAKEKKKRAATKASRLAKEKVANRRANEKAWQEQADKLGYRIVHRDRIGSVNIRRCADGHVAGTGRPDDLRPTASEGQQALEH